MFITAGDIRLRRPEPKDVEELYSFVMIPELLVRCAGFPKDTPGRICWIGLNGNAKISRTLSG